MNIVLDVALILFILLIVWRTSKHTILKVINDSLALVLSIIASSQVSIILAKLSFDQFFKNAVASKIEIDIEKISAMFSSSSNMERVIRLMPGFIRDSSVSYGLSNPKNGERVDYILQTMTSKEASVEISSIFAGPVIEGIFRAVFFIIFCFGFYAIYKAFTRFLEDSITSPSICYADSVFGSVFGGIRAILFILIILSFISLVFPIFPFTNDIIENNIQNSYLCKFFYNKNLLDFYIGSVKHIY